jgi:imidazolonepropionase-like amidohydrolase
MGGTRCITAGRFIEGSGADVRRNVFLKVKDGIITAIGSATDLARNAAIDDFSHCTLLPALVDCSVSLLRSPSVDSRVRLSNEAADLSQKTTLLKQHIRYCHIHGVLGVADNDASEVLQGYQKERARESIIDIRLPDPVHPNINYGTGGSTDADFLKIAYSTNIEAEESQASQLNPEDLCRILRLKGGKKAVVVANGPQHVKEALEAGCDAVEQGYGMGEKNLRRMAEKRVLWIPNVLRAKNALDGAGSGGEVCCRFSLRYVAPGKALPGAEAFWKKMLTEQLAQLRLAKTLGVTTALGTGAGSVGILHGESMVEEMKLFIKAGYSLEESIQCASENGAEFFGMEKLGRLAVGRRATFLITRGTVKQLPRKLAYLEGIYVDGVPSVAYRKNS